MKKEKTKKVIVISGASSGIGLATANYFLEKGWIVYGIATRKPELVNAQFNYIQADICNFELMQKIAKEIFDKEGQIDVLYNNAGFGISGPVEFTDESDVKRLFEVNVCAHIDMSRIYIPYLRKTRGKILFSSSVSGVASVLFQSCYGATKAAIESFALSLAKELRKQKIKVCCFRFGDINSNFTATRKKFMTTSEYYEPLLTQKTESMEHYEKKGTHPDKIAKYVYKTAQKKNPPLIVSVGFLWKFVSFLFRIVPTRLANWLCYKIY